MSGDWKGYQRNIMIMNLKGKLNSAMDDLIFYEDYDDDYYDYDDNDND